VQAAFDGAHGHIHYIGYLRVVHFFNVSQYNHQAELLIEFTQRGHYLPIRLGRYRRFLRSCLSLGGGG